MVFRIFLYAKCPDVMDKFQLFLEELFAVTSRLLLEAFETSFGLMEFIATQFGWSP